MSATSSPAIRQRRVEGIVPERKLLGITLVAIGLIVAAGFLLGELSQYTFLAISLTTLTAFALSREYAYAVPAGITGGLGTAVLLIVNQTFAAPYTPAVLFLSLAGGFATVYLLGLVADPPERHPWPLVPAAIIGALGLAFASGQPDAVNWVRIAVAGVIIAAGVGVLARRGHTA